MGEQIIPEYKLHNLGLGHVMLWRGGAAYRNFTLRLSLQVVFYTSSEDPTLPQSSLATCRLLLKRKIFT